MKISARITLSAALTFPLLYTSPALASSWGPFTSRLVPSPGGKYYVVVTNDEISVSGPLLFWFCEVAEGSAPVAARSASWPPSKRRPPGAATWAWWWTRPR